MRVLFLTHRVPYAPNRGDRLRAWHLVRHLAGRHEVTLASLAHDDEEAARIEDLAAVTRDRAAIRVTPLRNKLRGALALAAGSQRPLTHVLLDAPGMASALARLTHAARPDVVLAYCSSMARFALEPPLAGLPLVIDMVDADSAKWSDLSAVTGPPLRWIYRREARCLARFEEAAMRRAAKTLVVNDRDAQLLRAIAPGAPIVVVPNGIDRDYFAPPDPPAERPVVVFCGVMNYPPNEAGAVWLANDVWPLVRRQRPDAVLRLVGAQPTAAVQRLASISNGVDVTGAVPDVRPYLWEAAVACAPLHMARGIQNKVLEALAAGLPIVVTTNVAQGLPADVRPGCTVADEPAAFAQALVSSLAQDPGARRRAAAMADLSRLSWAVCLGPLDEILQAAANEPAPSDTPRPGVN